MRWSFWRWKRRETDLNEEIAHDLALETEEKVRSGMSRDEAERSSRRDFGNPTIVKESLREIWGWPSLERLAQDIRYALRMIRRNPAFSAVAVLTLALGIGANSGMFSLFDAVLLRLLPVRDPQQLYLLHEAGPDEGVEAVSFPMFERFRAALKGTAEVLTLTKPAPFHTRIGGAPMEPVTGQLVSGEFFSVLGVHPALGRLLTPDDNRSLGQHPVLVISHSYWQRRFGGDPGILARSLPVNGAPFAIVGVAEPGFFGVSVGELLAIARKRSFLDLGRQNRSHSAPLGGKGKAARARVRRR